MNKRSGHKRVAKKAHKRTERRGTRGYRKGSKSKTMKGKKDFTTKKTSKVFNRRKHYQKHAKGSRVVRKPYAKKGGALQPENHQPSGTCNFDRLPNHTTFVKSQPLRWSPAELTGYKPLRFW